MKANQHKITIKYIGICILAVFLTFFLHEGAHYLTGEILGYDMWMNLNSAGLKDGQTYRLDLHRQLVSISGPIFTIAQAVVLFFVIRKTKNLYWFPFLFIAALMRLFASIISAITIPNDEARVSAWLGIGKMTLPIIVSAFLIGLTIKTSIANNIPWKFNTISFIIISISITSLIFINQYYIK